MFFCFMPISNCAVGTEFFFFSEMLAYAAHKDAPFSEIRTAVDTCIKPVTGKEDDVTERRISYYKKSVAHPLLECGQVSDTELVSESNFVAT